MKQIIFSALVAVLLCSCSSKTPPKPHGTAFPINTSTQGNP